MQILLKITVDLLLLSIFTVGHTVLLRSDWRMRISKIVPAPMFFTIYGLHSAISLIMIFIFWQKLPGNIWLLSGYLKTAIEILMVISWLYMGYALFSTGAMKHIGVAQWVNHIRGKVTKYELIHAGAYHHCRHPIFLAFFGMIWFTPYMTTGHLLVTIYWSVYLYLGTLWKEEQLYRNASYREYADKVPAYPFFPKKMMKEILTFKKSNIENFGVPK